MLGPGRGRRRTACPVAGFVGLPPWFLRSGAGPNDWIPEPEPAAEQATPFRILPAEEMPHLVNPERGWIANANNDPIGTTLDGDPLNQLRPGGGLYYLSPGDAIGNRAGRVETLLEAELAGDGSVSPADMARIQEDVTLRDAEVLVPWITSAFQAASTPGAPPALAALAADASVAEAAARLGAWSGTTPTGIPECYDAADDRGVLGSPGGRRSQTASPSRPTGSCSAAARRGGSSASPVRAGSRRRT